MPYCQLYSQNYKIYQNRQRFVRKIIYIFLSTFYLHTTILLLSNIQCQLIRHKMKDMKLRMGLANLNH